MLSLSGLVGMLPGVEPPRTNSLRAESEHRQGSQCHGQQNGIKH